MRLLRSGWPNAANQRASPGRVIICFCPGRPSRYLSSHRLPQLQRCVTPNPLPRGNKSRGTACSPKKRGCWDLVYSAGDGSLARQRYRVFRQIYYVQLSLGLVPNSMPNVNCNCKGIIDDEWRNVSMISRDIGKIRFQMLSPNRIYFLESVSSLCLKFPTKDVNSIQHLSGSPAIGNIRVLGIPNIPRSLELKPITTCNKTPRALIPLESGRNSLLPGRSKRAKEYRSKWPRSIPANRTRRRTFGRMKGQRLDTRRMEADGVAEINRRREKDMKATAG